MPLLNLKVRKQKSDDTCGATCAHAVHRYWGRKGSLDKICRDVSKWLPGGTIIPLLGIWAANNGYRTEMWRSKWSCYHYHGVGSRVAWAMWELISEMFLDRGGIKAVAGGVSAKEFIQKHLRTGRPLIADLSDKTLYGKGGDGHFVVISGFKDKKVHIQDPYYTVGQTGRTRWVSWKKFLHSLKDGSETYGGCLLVFWPPAAK